MKQKTVESELIITMEEDLLSTTVRSCLTQAQKLLEEVEGVDALNVDISHVNTIDSQGLNFLVGIYQECYSRGWTFKVSGATASHKQLFQFVKLSERFGIAG